MMKRSLSILGILAAVSVSVHAGWAQPSAQPEAVAPAAQTCAVGASAAAEIASMAPTSTVEDFEAAILFTVSQAACSTEEAVSQLQGVAASPATPRNAVSALENIIGTLRQGVQRGTGAIGTGGSSGSSFSLPIVDIGGGGSNYSQ